MKEAEEIMHMLAATIITVKQTTQKIISPLSN